MRIRYDSFSMENHPTHRFIMGSGGVAEGITCQVGWITCQVGWITCQVGWITCQVGWINAKLDGSMPSWMDIF